MFHVPNKNVPAHTLARVNFPLYVVKALTVRHILVAGGGGESRTGVVNSIEIYELFKCPEGNTCRAKRVAHFDTGNRAIMNATVFQKGDYFLLATGGRFGTCVLYKIKFKIEDEDDLKMDQNQENLPQNKNGILRRRTSSFRLPNGKINRNEDLEKEETKSRTDLNDPKINLTFDITRVTDFQADFNEIKEPYLKVIKYSPSAKLVVTGGSDGFIRLFGYPDLRLIVSIPAHKDEITNFAIDSTGFKLVSISRDRRAFVWNLKERSRLKELKLNLNHKFNGKLIEYEFRDCSFGIFAEDPKQTVLYTVHNPFIRTKPPFKSLICRWNTRSYDLDQIVYTGLEPFSEITVSEDGKFLGVGLLTGTVEIYNAYTLKKIYKMENSHKLFVTGVEFLSSSFETKMLTGDQEASLLSISVDNHIVVHHLPKLQNDIGFLGSSFLFVVVLFLIYILFGLLGL